MDQLPRLGKREQICLLLFTCNYVVSVWRGFLFLWVLGMGYVLLEPSINYFKGDRATVICSRLIKSSLQSLMNLPDVIHSRKNLENML